MAVWLDVKPRLDRSSAEEAGIEAQRHFAGAGVKAGRDFGKGVADGIRSEQGDVRSALDDYKRLYADYNATLKRVGEQEYLVNEIRKRGFSDQYLASYLRDLNSLRQTEAEKLEAANAGYQAYEAALRRTTPEIGRLSAALQAASGHVEKVGGGLEKMNGHLLRSAEGAARLGKGFGFESEAAERVLHLGGTVERLGGSLIGAAGGLGTVTSAATAFGVALSVVSTVAISVAATVVGKLTEIGDAFDEASKKMVWQTGEFGEAAAQNDSIVRQLYASHASGLQTINSVVGGLVQSTHLAKEQLGDLSETVLDLSERGDNVDPQKLGMVGRLFNFKDGQDYITFLGELKGVSEKTGVSVSSLVNTMSSMGPVLQQFHLNSAQSVGFAAEAINAGISPEDTKKGLQAAAKAAAGDKNTPAMDPNQFLRQQIAAMQQAQAAGNQALLNQIAEKTFGPKGTGLTDAIEQGKVDLTQLTQLAQGAYVNIKGLHDSTDTLGEKFEELKHRLESALQPLASGVLSMIAPKLEQISNWAGSHGSELITWFTRVGSGAIRLGVDIEHFVSFGIRTLALFEQVTGRVLGTALHWISDFSGALGGILKHIPGMQGIGESMENAAKSGHAMADSMFHAGDNLNALANKMDSAAEGASRFAAGMETAGERAAEAQKLNDALGESISSLKAAGEDVTIDIKDDTPEVEAKLTALGMHVQHMPDGTIKIVADTQTAQQILDAWRKQQENTPVNINVNAWISPIPIPVSGHPGFTQWWSGKDMPGASGVPGSAGAGAAGGGGGGFGAADPDTFGDYPTVAPPPGKGHKGKLGPDDDGEREIAKLHDTIDRLNGEIQEDEAKLTETQDQQEKNRLAGDIRRLEEKRDKAEKRLRELETGEKESRRKGGSSDPFMPVKLDDNWFSGGLPGFVKNLVGFVEDLALGPLEVAAFHGIPDFDGASTKGERGTGKRGKHSQENDEGHDTEPGAVPHGLPGTHGAGNGVVPVYVTNWSGGPGGGLPGAPSAESPAASISPPSAPGVGATTGATSGGGGPRGTSPAVPPTATPATPPAGSPTPPSGAGQGSGQGRPGEVSPPPQATPPPAPVGNAPVGSRTWVEQQLLAAGIPPDQVRGLMAMNTVEGGDNTPMSILGFTESQAAEYGGGPEGHVRALIQQWNSARTRSFYVNGRPPGTDAAGNVVDPGAYLAFIQAMVGQAGVQSDWQGNAQPSTEDYRGRLQRAWDTNPPVPKPPPPPARLSNSPKDFWNVAGMSPDEQKSLLLNAFTKPYDPSAKRTTHPIPGLPIGPSRQYAIGGLVRYFATGGPSGTDTIPAWLSPGEFVMNAQATQQFLPYLQFMNAGHFQGGGLPDTPPPPAPPSPAPPPPAAPNNKSPQKQQIPGQPSLQAAKPQSGQKGGPQPDADAPDPAPLGATQPGSDVHNLPGLATPGADSQQPGQGLPPSSGIGFGGGILGSAEGAASAGADLFAPGSGAAAQIAFQEINRAAAFGAQAAGIGVEGILEALIPSSGAAGGDWGKTIPGRLLMGVTGVRPTGQNTAGNTQQAAQSSEGGGSGGSVGVQVQGDMHVHAQDPNDFGKQMDRESRMANNSQPFSTAGR